MITPESLAHAARVMLDHLEDMCHQASLSQGYAASHHNWTMGIQADEAGRVALKLLIRFAADLTGVEHPVDTAAIRVDLCTLEGDAWE